MGLWWHSKTHNTFLYNQVRLAPKVANNKMPDLNSKFIRALDDEFDIVTSVKQGLQKYGFNIFAFTDPLMALEHLKLNIKDYDIVISDIEC